MVTTAVKPSEPLRTARAPWRQSPSEVVAYCPGCKTLESLSFSGSTLVTTRKFDQRGGRVYHDCGSSEPCRLYRAY